MEKLEPILKTDRLLLSRFVQEDVADIFAYAKDPRLTKFVTWDAHQTLADSQAFLAFAEGQYQSDPAKFSVVWAMRLRADEKAIGSINFQRISSLTGKIDYALGADYWRTGITSDAARAVIAWAFATFPELERVQAQALPENEGSLAVMKKVGMKFEGVNRSVMRVRGHAEDLAMFAVIRSEFSGAAYSV